MRTRPTNALYCAVGPLENRGEARLKKVHADPYMSLLK
jgi:hypothetical protein